MNYAEIKPKLKTGDLIAYSDLKWGTWMDVVRYLIGFATDSKFYHVGIVYLEEDRVFVMEAVSSGVRIRPLSDSLPFHHIAIPCELNAEAVTWAFSKLGTPYESKWRMFVNLFVKLDLKSNNRLQCCEYVNGILYAANQSLGAEDTPGAIVKAAWVRWGELNFVKGDTND